MRRIGIPMILIPPWSDVRKMEVRLNKFRLLEGFLLLPLLAGLSLTTSNLLLLLLELLL